MTHDNEHDNDEKRIWWCCYLIIWQWQWLLYYDHADSNPDINDEDDNENDDADDDDADDAADDDDYADDPDDDGFFWSRMII